MDPRKALFMVNDIAEQATWAGASRSHEGVWAALSKLVDVTAMVMGSRVEAQRLMSDEVVAHRQVSLLCPTLSLSSTRESYFPSDGVVIFFSLHRS